MIASNHSSKVDHCTDVDVCYSPTPNPDVICDLGKQYLDERFWKGTSKLESNCVRRAYFVESNKPFRKYEVVQVSKI
jgi:hypothetical protein